MIKKKYNDIAVLDGHWQIIKLFFSANKCIVEPEQTDVTEEGEEILVKEAKQDKNILISRFMIGLAGYMKKYPQRTFKVCFDKGSYRYRGDKKKTNYKATRDKSAYTWKIVWEAIDDLIPLLRSIGVDVIRIPGVEADDLAYYYSHASESCILITRDKDWLLAVTPTTEIHLQGTKAIKGTVNTWETIIDGELFKEPGDLVVHKAIFGDSGDNIISVEKSKTLTKEEQRAWIERVKNGEITDQKSAERLELNMVLGSIEHIADDEEVHGLIHDQERLTRHNIKPMSLNRTLIQLNPSVMHVASVFNGYLHRKV